MSHHLQCKAGLQWQVRKLVHAQVLHQQGSSKCTEVTEQHHDWTSADCLSKWSNTSTATLSDEASLCALTQWVQV